MTVKPYFVAAVAALLIPCVALSAQTETTHAPAQLPEPYWVPKLDTAKPYVEPNKVHWKLSEILDAHSGQSDWTQPIVRNRDQVADYISLGAGKKTKSMFYADDRLVFIVQNGAIKVTIQGVEPFTATKGFMVNVPRRHVYSLETVSAGPSLRFEIRQAGALPLYPASEQPDPVSGSTYMLSTGTPAVTVEEPSNPIFLDFWKDVAVDDRRHGGPFVRDDHFTANVIRNKGVPVPPDTDLGHFHIDATEFWFIMEGKIGYKIEGFPYFEADQGDVVSAAAGRWHRAAHSPNTPMSTRIPINPRPPVLHNRQHPLPKF